MTMRIAYMTGEYPRATDTFIQREVEALRRRGVEVRTFSIRKPPGAEQVGAEQERYARDTSYVLPCGPFRLLGAHLRALCGSPLRYFRQLRLSLSIRSPGVKAFLYQLFYFTEAAVVAAELKRSGAGHLHNHFANSSCSVAMVAAGLAGIPFSFTIHGPQIFFEPRRWALGEKVARAKFVSCISHFCRSQAMIFASPEHWDRLHIVHCAVVPEEFAAERSDEGGGARFLFVGRLAEVKGIGILLDAFARFAASTPDAALDIVGDGPDRAMLEARARELGVADRVVFHGYRSRAEVRERLLAADAFVMASFAEGVPVVLMEAMAAGLPVVATRIAGVPELVEDGVGGYLVAPGDVEGLAGRMAEIAGSSALRARLGAAGRRKVEEEFDLAIEAGRLHRLFAASPGDDPLPVRPPAEASR